MTRLRHTDEWVGLLVVVAVLLFLGAVLEAGVLREWFRPVYQLRVVLPESGVGGLAVGADIEVLGTRSGTVRRIVLNPNQQMYAEADIDQQAGPFIRRDSQAVIRRRFGVAGAAYLDISRGSGEPMDWNYAVINASTERAATDTISAMISEVQQKIFPVLDDAKRMTGSLVAMTENLQKGQGSVGRLLTDDTLAHNLEETAAAAQQQVAGLGPTLAKLDDMVKQLDAVVQMAASGKEGLPNLLRRVDALLANLQSSTRDLARASANLPQISRNMAGTTADLPALLTQTQVTTAELERLLTQLRGMWLLGGGGAPANEPRRLPATQIQP